MKPLMYRFQKLALSFLYTLTALLGIDLPPFASSSAIITNKQGQLLLVDLSYKKGYALPGGLLQANETFTQGLLREIKEETNLDVKVGSLLGIYKATTDFPTVNLVYKAELVSERIVNSDEGIVSWQKPSEVINKIAYSDNQEAIKDYFKL